jgi:hypothetical protein
MKVPGPNLSILQRAFKKRDRRRRNWCRRCPFRAPSGQCRDTRIRSGRCGDWVYYLLPGNKQCRRRWVRPKDPHTPAQRQSRARLSAASRKYSAGLTEEERAASIAAAAKQQSRPRLGQSGPLTGHQYSVRSDYAANAGGKVQNTGIPAKVPRPKRVTRPTWGTHRGITGMPPEQRVRRSRVTDGGRKAVVGSGLLQREKVMRFTWQRYRSGAVLVLVRRRRGTASARPLRARLMQRMGVRPMPARRPAPRLYGAP